MAELASPQFVVDTNIIVDYLRRREATLRSLLRRYRCAMTAVTLYELKALPTLSLRQEQQIVALCEVMTVLPFGEQTADVSARIARGLHSQGSSIGLPDTLIAGTCLAANLPLLTHNTRHYERVPGLGVLDPTTLIQSGV